jgi:HNH endonuclease/AP2 domain
MAARNLLTQARLRQLLTYDPQTGLFTWKIRRRGPRGKAGEIAGMLSVRGYIVIKADGIRYRAHRLVWLYMTGKWPNGDLDHRNGARDDNRWSNLRSASRSQNLANSRISKNNTSGYKGVSFNSINRRWRASIKCNKAYHLGYFDTAEAAHRAYVKKAKEFFGAFARAR